MTDLTPLYELAERMTWRPIEEAPRHGTSVLLTDGDNIAEASFWVNEWMLHIGDNPCCHRSWLSVCEAPTHFMPLPTGKEGSVMRVLLDAIDLIANDEKQTGHSLIAKATLTEAAKKLNKG
jgi:hypothetical protein